MPEHSQSGVEGATSSAVSAVETAVASGDRLGAYEIANRAISQGLRHPIFFIVRAQKMEASGQFGFALEDYQRASDLDPNDIGILDAMADCAARGGDFQLAAACLTAALALRPHSASLQFRSGTALAQAGDMKAAQKAFEGALALEPKNVDAAAGLALILAQQGQSGRARSLATEALGIVPEHATALSALLHADMADGRYRDAEERTKPLLAIMPYEARPGILALRGDALDRQSRFADAFAAYREKNEALSALYGSRYSGNSALDFVRHHTAHFENEPPNRWRPPDEMRDVPHLSAGHVFLLGFMRSGTTLLQQILAVNPVIAVMEEKAHLGEARNRYMSGMLGLETLVNLDAKTLADVGDGYWGNVRRSVPDLSNRVVLDKHPSNTENLPLIAMLFPEARVILALRDPRDVVFSCFRRNLKMSPTQYEFLTLKRCAQYYAATMQLAEVYRAKLALKLLEHRYEDTIEDFDASVRRVCEFVGIDWLDSMRDFNETAPVPDLLSASVMQVRRPLFEEGIGHWRNYADQMKPVLPILEPWVERFGYSRD